jgi:methylmalonyl-CoA/ethylmalonyl-CoA epimerase
LLQKESDDERIGVDHFGLWVDDLEAATEQVVAAGATPVGTHGPPGELAFYEAKFLSPDGIVFDLSHTGWPGAAKGPSSSDD